MIKIVVLDGFPLNPGDNPWDPAFCVHDFHCFDRTCTDDVVQRSRDAEVLLTNKVRIDDNIMSHLSRLRLILVMATGFDVVDVRAAQQRGIIVCNAPAYSTAGVAELTIGLILALCRRPEKHAELLAAGDRGEGADFSFWRSPQVELAEKNLGIIGFGQIGSRVARIAAAMEMNVLVTSRGKKQGDNRPRIVFCGLPELLAQADIVSLHCPLTDATRRLVDAPFLSQMKRGAMLVNTARGGLMDEIALAAALRSGHLAGAAVDTLVREPVPSDSPLLNLENCLVTPHIGWATLASRQRLMRILADNLRGYLAGTPQNVVSLG